MLLEHRGLCRLLTSLWSWLIFLKQVIKKSLVEKPSHGLDCLLDTLFFIYVIKFILTTRGVSTIFILITSAIAALSIFYVLAHLPTTMTSGGADSIPS